MSNPYSTVLCHHGILGQKWGVRRFQDKNGDLTAEGRKRYESKTSYGTSAKINKDLNEYKKQNRLKFKIEMNEVRAKKREGLITNKEAKQIRKEKIQKTLKNNERETQAALKAYAQTTKRGKNIVTGLLATTGGIGLTALGSYAEVKGRTGVSIVSTLLSAPLMGIGLSNLVNEASASKYRKEKRDE